MANCISNSTSSYVILGIKATAFFLLSIHKLCVNLWKKRLIKREQTPVNKGFAKTKEDRRKNGVMQRKADL